MASHVFFNHVNWRHINWSILNTKAQHTHELVLQNKKQTKESCCNPVKPVAVAFRYVSLNDISYTLFCCFINAAAPSWWHRMCSIATSWLRYDGDISDWMGCRLNLLPDWSVTLSNDIGEKVGGVGNIKLATSQSPQYRCPMYDSAPCSPT